MGASHTAVPLQPAQVLYEKKWRHLLVNISLLLDILVLFRTNVHSFGLALVALACGSG